MALPLSGRPKRWPFAVPCTFRQGVNFGWPPFTPEILRIHKAVRRFPIEGRLKPHLLVGVVCTERDLQQALLVADNGHRLLSVAREDFEGGRSIYGIYAY